MKQRGGTERGISPTIGAVLLVAIVVISMAFVGAILGTSPFGAAPNGTFVFNEDSDTGEITIGAERAYNLDASETTIVVQNGDECTEWDGSGAIEQGDSMTIKEGDDCDFGTEDTIQIISDETLIDSHEVLTIT